MAEPRKICVVTGTRAEYGLLFWLMREIERDPRLNLQLVVTGTHLDSRFGKTVDAIERDGFTVDVRIPLDLADDTPAGITNATAAALAGMGKALAELTPDIMVLLGDRYEILAAAAAAALHRVPIAHIHGGEVTEGAIDDAMRHAVTKLSSLHFPAADAYRDRIIQMGEAPQTVQTVGAPGLDHLEHTTLLSAEETARELGIDDDTPYFLITMHPATLGEGSPEAEVDALLTALDQFENHVAVFTGVNADAGRDAIAARIEKYVAQTPGRARLFTSLGQRRYLSAMKYCAAVVGNSSSGIIEAPSLKTPTVNIGERQRGRVKAKSIIDCTNDTESIERSIKKAMQISNKPEKFLFANPYEKHGTSDVILKLLSSFCIDRNIKKAFYDIPFES